jgi:diadenosine tetraphosphate (Ap4A) HIT family hydrolase
VSHGHCALCTTDGRAVVFRHAQFRVVRAQEAGFPGFYRVIWNAHVAEWSDLSPTDQVLCMSAVTAVERALRDVLAPDKVNLATLGNVVPHLHWHVIARYRWDSHFPAPVWGAAVREAPADLLEGLVPRLGTVESRLQAALAVL